LYGILDSKELYKKYTLLFNKVISGYCNCDNPKFWKPSNFCDLYNGIFSKDNEIYDFLINNFIINKINNWIDNIINLLIPYFLFSEKEKKIITI